MTITMDNQAVIPTHRWRGIASSIIGATSIIVTVLLFVAVQMLWKGLLWS